MVEDRWAGVKWETRQRRKGAKGRRGRNVARYGYHAAAGNMLPTPGPAITRGEGPPPPAPPPQGGRGDGSAATRGEGPPPPAPPPHGGGGMAPPPRGGRSLLPLVRGIASGASGSRAVHPCSPLAMTFGTCRQCEGLERWEYNKRCTRIPWYAARSCSSKRSAWTTRTAPLAFARTVVLCCRRVIRSFALNAGMRSAQGQLLCRRRQAQDV